MDLPADIKKAMIVAQKNEITEYHIYLKLAKSTKHVENSKIIEQIGKDELRHYHFFKEYTETEVKPNKWKVISYYWIARIFGITFGIKLMENGESRAQKNYEKIAQVIPEVRKIEEEEETHENALIAMIKEEALDYMGSVVLGLNDALVELTGALAGLTLALQDSRLIALTGSVMGIAASFSMAASEYLSTKSEGNADIAIKSSLYTGVAYIFTVVFLVLPFLLLSNPFISLFITLGVALTIILLFNYYISVAKDYSFKKRFLEMATISMGVAALSFGIGYLIKIGLGVDV